MDGVSAQRTRRAHRVDGIHCHRRATIYAKLQFDAQMYDSYEDNDTFSRGNVRATIKGAWARRLSDVAQLHIGSCGERLPESAARMIGCRSVTYA
jgi:hypothetical protein